MKITTLEGIDHIKILTAFNESFSDYFVPLKLTMDQLASKMITDKIDLELSVGVFENKKLIAFILHGFDIINNQKVVYNGGTGVIPEKRGYGLTKQMYLFNLPLLEEKGIDKIILEVISKNIQAIKSYQKVGFKTIRELACYKGSFNTTNSNNKIEIKTLQNYPWEAMESFWDITPTWQNSKNAVNILKKVNSSWGAYMNDELVGYLIYNPTSHRIQQMATHRYFRKKGIASKLITELVSKYGNTFSVINVDKKAKDLTSFFDSIGYEEYIEQLEMELEIN